MGDEATVVMGIDPGTDTGVAVHNLETGEWVHEEIRSKAKWSNGALSVDGWPAELEVCDLLLALVGTHDVTEIAIEDFVLRGGTHSSKRTGLSPVRITTMLMTSLWFGSDDELTLRSGAIVPSWPDISHVQFFSASNAKTTFTDDRLRSRDLYASNDHKRDAVRQVLMWERKNVCD